MQFLLDKRFQILETIGTGSMSTVHLAIDTQTKTKVAVKEFKTIAQDELEEFIIRFKKEAEIISKLSHPNIIKVHQLIREKDYFYLIMEYFQGKNLKISMGQFDLTQKVEIMRELADTLSYIHAKDIIHRDLKPENILIQKNQGIEIKIIDFGLANLMDIQDSFRKGTLVGTLAYISPEQTGILRRTIDNRSDLYSLGATFYELLTGQPPFQEKEIGKLIHMHLATKPDKPSLHNPEIPPMIDKIILKLLNKEPQERYQSAQGLKEDLDFFLKHPDKPFFEMAQKDTISSLNFQIKLIDREDEMRILQQKHQEVINLQPKSILIKSKTGMGKTKLVESFKESIKLHENFFLSCPCSQTGKNTPYHAFFTLTKQYFDHFYQDTDRDFILNSLGKDQEIVFSLAPHIREKLQGALTEPPQPLHFQKEEIFHAFCVLMQILGNLKHNLIFWLDDIQWIDQNSLDLLTYFSKNLKKTKVMLIFTGNNETEEETVFAKLLENNPDLKTIHLQPLTKEYLPLFISAMINEETIFEKEFYLKIFDVTLGNPLFIQETMKILYENQVLSQSDYHFTVDLDKMKGLTLENDISKLLIKRLFAFTPEERQILSIAAIIGREFDFNFLGEIMNVKYGKKDLDFLVNTIDKAKREQILQEKPIRRIGSYSFVNEKIMDSLKQTISPEELEAIHLLCAVVIEINYSDNMDDIIYPLAFHYNQTNCYDKIIYYNDLAYKEALSYYSVNEALFFMEKNIQLDLTQNKISLKTVLLLKETAHYLQLIGQIQKSFDYLNQALKIINQNHWEKEKIDILLEIGTGYYYLNETNQAMNYYNQAMELATKWGQEIHIGNPYYLMGSTFWFFSDYPKAIDNFNKAILYFDKDDWNNLLPAYAMRSATYVAMGKLAEAFQDVKMLESGFLKTDNTVILPHAYHCAALCYCWGGRDYEKALKYSILAYQFAEKSHNLVFQYSSLFSRTLAYYYLGKYEMALEMIEKGLSISKKHNIEVGVHLYHAYHAEILLCKKDFEKANEIAERFINEKDQINDKITVLLFIKAHAIYLYSLGKVEESLKILDEGIQLFHQTQIAIEGIPLLLLKQYFLKRKGIDDMKLEQEIAVWKMDRDLSFIFDRSASMIKRIEEAKKEKALKSDHSNSRTFLKENLQLHNIIKTSQLISSILDVNELLEAILEKTLEVTGAERGILVIYQEEQPPHYITKNIDRQNEDFKLSNSVLQKVLEHKKGFIFTSLDKNDDFSISASILAQNIRSIISVPLIFKGVVKGILYLDSKLLENLFTDDDLELLEVFTTQAAIALDNAETYQKLEQERNLLENKVKERTQELEVMFEALSKEKKVIEIQNKRFKEELYLAKNIQIGLIPESSDTARQQKGVQIYSVYQPMEEVGGDFFDLIQFKEENLFGLFISDVAGHGVPAALITSMIKAILVNSDSFLKNPAQFAEHLNKKLIPLCGQMFLTCFYAIYDNQRKELTYIRCAHPYPILIRKGSWHFIEERGSQILGMFDNIVFENKTIRLETGDKLIFYTDGLIESTDSQGVHFLKKLPQLLNQFSNLSLQELIQTIYIKMIAHHGQKNFNDDVCMIGIEIQ